jgi:hypothetical protein
MPATDPTITDACRHASLGWNHPHTPKPNGGNSARVKTSHIRQHRPRRRPGADGDPAGGSGLA